MYKKAFFSRPPLKNTSSTRKNRQEKIPRNVRNALGSMWNTDSMDTIRTQRYAETAAIFSLFLCFGSMHMKMGIMRTARLIRSWKTLQASSFIFPSFQPVMIIGVFALLVKIAGHGHHLPAGHLKTGFLQGLHMVQVHDIALVAAQKLRKTLQLLL